MSICAPTFLIPEKCALDLAFDLRDVDFIGNKKNGYLVLIVVSLLVQLLVDVHYISEVIMLSNIIVDSVTKLQTTSLP